MKEIKLVRQPLDSYSCGQAVVATIAGITLDESIEIFKTKGKTDWMQIHLALRALHIPHNKKSCTIYNCQKFTGEHKFCIVAVKFKKGKSYWEHYALYANEKYYDPYYGILHSYNDIAVRNGVSVRVSSYMELYSK